MKLPMLNYIAIPSKILIFVFKDLSFYFYFYFFGVYKALDDQSVLVCHERVKTMAYVPMFY